MPDSIDILWELAIKVAGYKSVSTSRGWRMGEGMSVFVDPPAMCPHCREWFRTNRIWVVDENNGKLAGCWDMKTGQPPPASLVHPHSGSNRGSICKGNNHTYADALFIGISAGTHYYSTERWLFELGHDCPYLTVRVTCQICRRSHPKVGTHNYGHGSFHVCSRYCYTLAKYFRCMRCYKETGFYTEPKWERYCEECFNASSTACHLCGDVQLTYTMSRLGRTNHRVCRTCIHYGDKLKYCGSCERVYLSEEIISRRCRHCSPSLFPTPIEPVPTISSDVDDEHEEEDDPDYYDRECRGCYGPVGRDRDYCHSCCCADCVAQRQARRTEEAAQQAIEEQEEEEEDEVRDPWDYDGDGSDDEEEEED